MYITCAYIHCVYTPAGDGAESGKPWYVCHAIPDFELKATPSPLSFIILAKPEIEKQRKPIYADKIVGPGRGFSLVP